MDVATKLDRYGFFEARAPRYTSYPPANRFGATTGGEHQQNWLKAVPNGSSISLYLHIPFCRRLCWFCACRTQGTQSLRPVEAYVETLIKEIDLVADTLTPSIKLDRVHIGGGTPTILSAELMDRLLLKLFSRFETTLDCEFSVEIDPTDCTEDVVYTLSDYGMNRASIGVQDFDPKVQESIGRLQSIEQTEETIGWLRKAGIRSLNIDLLYGLPYQNALTFNKTLDETISLNPDRIALFGYAHVPKMSKRQVLIPADALPTGHERYDLSQIAVERFHQAGLLPVGIDHFAKLDDSLYKAVETGKLHRNFQGYTDDDVPYLIGLGASSITEFPHGYAQNAVGTGAYVDRIEKGELAAQRGYRFEGADRLFSDIIETLMCKFEIDFAYLRTKYTGFEDELAWVRVQIKRFYAEVFEEQFGRFVLKSEFEPLTRIICQSIDPAHAAEFGSHSLAS